MKFSLQIVEKSSRSFWLNIESLKILDYNLIDKITATITVSDLDDVKIKVTETNLTVRDLSIPIELWEDSRLRSNDITVNQFSNYGILIDGSVNPVEYAKLEFNDQDRFKKRVVDAVIYYCYLAVV